MSESIYNLIPAESIIQHKQPLHKSRYDPTIPPTASTFLGTSNVPLNVSGESSYTTSIQSNKYVQNPLIKSYSHMGPKTQHIPDTSNYLKKTSVIDPTTGIFNNTTNTQQSSTNKFQYTTKNKPLLDNYNKSYHPGSNNINMNTKNYIHENMLAVIMSDCKKPSSDKINYLHKSDYGVIPSYLTDIKSTIQDEKNYIKSILQQSNQNQNDNQPRMRLLPDVDRVNMLSVLKSQWDIVHASYQSMTHLTVLDPRKIKQKDELENRLNSLEQSIEKLSKPLVYVQEE